MDKKLVFVFLIISILITFMYAYHKSTPGIEIKEIWLPEKHNIITADYYIALEDTTIPFQEYKERFSNSEHAVIITMRYGDVYYQTSDNKHVSKKSYSSTFFKEIEKIEKIEGNQATVYYKRSWTGILIFLFCAFLIIAMIGIIMIDAMKKRKENMCPH